MEGPLLPCHHLVLGALQAKGPRSETEAKSLMQQAIEDCGGPANLRDFHTFIEPINGRLDEVQLEIRAGVLQQTGETFYGVVNKTGDEQAKLGTHFKHAEVSYFKAVVEAIAIEEDTRGSIGTNQAVNLCSSWQAESQPQGGSSQAAATAAKSLSLSQKQALLQTLSDQKWLQLEGGRVGLGIRTYLELKAYLRDVERVKTCEVCNEAAIQARACNNPECSCRMHSYCVERKFKRTPNDSRVCPECNQTGSWQSDTPPSSQPARGRARPRSAAAAANGEGPSSAADGAAATPAERPSVGGMQEREHRSSGGTRRGTEGGEGTSNNEPRRRTRGVSVKAEQLDGAAGEEARRRTRPRRGSNE